MKHSFVVQKIFVGLALSLAPVEAQRGYQLSGDEVVVDLAQHWRQWTIPAHLAHIDEAGSVRTRQLRTVYNVLEDRALRRPITINTDDPRIGTIDSTMQFDVFGEPIRNTLNELVFDYWVRPGISRVGSNPQLADRILDGDPTTFWEPDPRDPIEQWWIEVDLGRAVPVERLKLQFVDEEIGDPFLQFIMLLSRRQSALLHEPNSRIGFQLFIPQDAPSTTQREYIFESEHTSPELPPASGVVSDRLLIEARKPSPEWTGKSLETIRIVITDTRGGRAEQITRGGVGGVVGRRAGGCGLLCAGRGWARGASGRGDLSDPSRRAAGAAGLLPPGIAALGRGRGLGLGRQYRYQLGQKRRLARVDHAGQESADGIRRGRRYLLLPPNPQSPQSRRQCADRRYWRCSVAGAGAPYGVGYARLYHAGFRWRTRCPRWPQMAAHQSAGARVQRGRSATARRLGPLQFDCRSPGSAAQGPAPRLDRLCPLSSGFCRRSLRKRSRAGDFGQCLLVVDQRDHAVFQPSAGRGGVGIGLDRVAGAGGSRGGPLGRRHAAGHGRGNPHAHRRPTAAANPLLRQNRQRKDCGRIQNLGWLSQGAFGYHGGRRTGVEHVEPAVSAAGGVSKFAESAALYAAPSPAQKRWWPARASAAPPLGGPASAGGAAAARRSVADGSGGRSARHICPFCAARFFSAASRYAQLGF